MESKYLNPSKRRTSYGVIYSGCSPGAAGSAIPTKSDTNIIKCLFPVANQGETKGAYSPLVPTARVLEEGEGYL